MSSETEPNRKTPARETISTAILEEFQKQTGWTDQQLSTYLYQSKGVVADWKKKGLAPAWVQLAIDQLRWIHTDIGVKSVYVLTCRASDADTIARLLRTFPDVELNHILVSRGEKGQ